MSRLDEARARAREAVKRSDLAIARARSVLIRLIILETAARLAGRTLDGRRLAEDRALKLSR